jgi:hypothetical protein
LKRSRFLVCKGLPCSLRFVVFEADRDRRSQLNNLSPISYIMHMRIYLPLSLPSSSLLALVSLLALITSQCDHLLLECFLNLAPANAEQSRANLQACDPYLYVPRATRSKKKTEEPRRSKKQEYKERPVQVVGFGCRVMHPVRLD